MDTMDTTNVTVDHTIDGTDSISLTLEDATQLLLQHGVDGTVQIAPGTYQILSEDGTVHVTGILANDDSQLTSLQGEGFATVSEASFTQVSEHEYGQVSEDISLQLPITSESDLSNARVIIQTAEDHTENGILLHNHRLDELSESGILNEGSDKSNGITELVSNGIDTIGSVLEENKCDVLKQSSVENEGFSLDTCTGLLTVNNCASHTDNREKSADDRLPSIANETDNQSVSAAENETAKLKAIPKQPKVPKPPPPPRKPDLSQPINFDGQTEVVINGKKCTIMTNPETGDLCAYPLLPPEGTRKRGRPKKQPRPEGEEEKKEDKPKNVLPSTTDAAEGLLELSNIGPDGIRRSSRPKKKAKTLEDYEILDVSEGEQDNDSDEDVLPSGVTRKKSTAHSNQYSQFMVGGAIKRGRGRPRRYPPPGQQNIPAQIPAMVIPTSDGQTLVMAPMQGIQNLQAFQEQARNIITFNPTITSAPVVSEPIVSTTALTTIPAPENVTQIAREEETPATDIVATTPIDAQTDSPDVSNSASLDTVMESPEPVPQTVSTAEDVQDSSLGTLPSIDPSSTPTTGSSIVITTQNSSDSNQQTFIQIPDNLLPMFLPKKDPVKIGLKAAESDLEKLKCPKCDFQAFYQQQYQEHIATHTQHTEIERCKCCTYLTFDKEDLINHFKEIHPKCICDVCDFTAEHAYVIKRHMQRHSAVGCTCDVCGKVYKDQYILKMHIKMVHMPAEVLFECDVCMKKFTRKAHLKRHLRTHGSEKPYKCPQCDYRGCEKSDISKHILIHEEPRHICEVCGKQFRHIKNKELHVKRHNGQKDYKCGVCDFYGYTFTDIRKHIERKHSDIKTFVCEKCGTPFRSEVHLQHHKNHQCDFAMIEQALAIATSTGGKAKATLQIPTSSIAVDHGHLTIDGQQIQVGDQQVDITVEEVNLPDDEYTTFTEEQIAQGHITVSEGQIIDASGIMPGAVIHTVDQSEVDINQPEEEDLLS